MAVETTVEVVMPAMGDSVSEGTILEWRKQEGDQATPNCRLPTRKEPGTLHRYPFSVSR